MAYTFSGRCKGITKPGTQCGDTVVYANGLCKQHGGDSTEHERERLERMKQKALKSFRKWRRKHERVPA